MAQGEWCRHRYYVIDAGTDPAATATIQSAIAIFNADFPTVIQWIPWSASFGPNYVDIDLNAFDFSGQREADEGYEARPAQPMTGSTSCTVGTILHEMGHVIVYGTSSPGPTATPT